VFYLTLSGSSSGYIPAGDRIINKTEGMRKEAVMDPFKALPSQFAGQSGKTRQDLKISYTQRL
jgi:hypothetical protein